jgi:acetyltransferase
MSTITSLSAAEIPIHLSDLMELLHDAVESDASIGFLPPLSDADADAYWRDVAEEVAAGDKHLLVAWAEERIVGTVQLALAPKPNARHRAEIQKLLVHRRHRRQGLGAALMRAAETLAQTIGRPLLVLDTLKAGGAETLYEQLGYHRVGEIPYFAEVSDGTLQSTVLYYRWLGTPS